MSCHSATANQVRLVLHTAAFWLMHGVRAAIPRTSPLARAEFTTIRDRLIKIGARVIEYIARIRVQLPTSCPEGALFRAVALGLMPSRPRAAEPRGRGPDEPPIKADQSQTRCTASCATPTQTNGSSARDRRPNLKKPSPWCMISAREGGAFSHRECYRYRDSLR